MLKPRDKVLALMVAESGKHFDPDLLKVFLQIEPLIHDDRQQKPS